MDLDAPKIHSRLDVANLLEPGFLTGLGHEAPVKHHQIPAILQRHDPDKLDNILVSDPSKRCSGKASLLQVESFSRISITLP